MTPVRMLELSLRGFGLGIFGLVPVVGLGPALLAIHYFMHVRVRSAGRWNAGAAYLAAGFWCGAVGVFVSVVFLSILLIALVSA